jgi:hypothetical protein
MARENVENTIRPLGVLMDWPERGAGLGRDAREGNLLNQVFLADVIDCDRRNRSRCRRTVRIPGALPAARRLVPFQARLWLRRLVLLSKPQHHDVSMQ